MNEKSMKSCVRVLRVEAGVRYYSIRLLEKIVDVILDGVSLVNWCIVRSILRWAGFPISIIIFYCIFVTPVTSFILCAASALTFTATIISWSEINSDEHKVFYEYEKEKEKKV